MSRDNPCFTKLFHIDAGTRVVALVGGGGKTSLMYRLAWEMRSLGLRVISTTTTRIFPPNADQSPLLLTVADDPELRRLPEALRKFGHVTVGHSLLDVGKVEGISSETIRIGLECADAVLVEADGAAGRPLKAPESWEPVVPEAADLVIPVVGLECIGSEANSETVFRLERFLALTGMREGSRITPWTVGLLLAHKLGGLKAVPARARVIPFLNKVDLLADTDDIALAAREIGVRAGNRIKSLVVGALKDPNATAGYAIRVV
ncbi:selenium cofactor biosynthesis protein YqeC [Thermodesulfobacteriota bacterium]